MINTHIEASKIGRQIAEQVLDSQKQGGESSSDSSPNPDPESSLPLPTADVRFDSLKIAAIRYTMCFVVVVF